MNNYFKTDNWLEIVSRCKNRTALKRYDVGDTKKITLKNGDEVELVIIGKEHDLLQNDKKSVLTIAFNKCLSPDYKLDCSDKLVDWSSCDFRNINCKQIIELFPYSLANSIKEVVKHSVRDGKDIYTLDSLWLLSKRELTGVGLNEGDQYEYYKENSIKSVRCTYDTPVTYYTRSLQSFDDKNFYYVNEQGKIDYGKSFINRCALIAFCM